METASVNRPEAFTTFRTALSDLFEAFSAYNSPNEATTEQELIRPILELLGWTDYLPQQGASRNEDVPDLPVVFRRRFEGKSRSQDQAGRSIR